MPPLQKRSLERAVNGKVGCWQEFGLWMRFVACPMRDKEGVCMQPMCQRSRLDEIHHLFSCIMQWLSIHMVICLLPSFLWIVYEYMCNQYFIHGFLVCQEVEFCFQLYTCDFSVNFIQALKVTYLWSNMTLNYWMMVERYPNLKEEVGDSIPACEIFSLLDRITCQAVDCLLCSDAGLSAFCRKKEKRKRKRKVTYLKSSNFSSLIFKGYFIAPLCLSCIILLF